MERKVVSENSLEITHLFQHAQHTHAVAQMIYNEFWIDVVGGLTLDFLDTHLHTTHDPSRIPLSWIALVDGQLAGTINLIENDDRTRTHLRPWLAALVVAKEFRGQGIGAQLVRTLLAEAERLGFATVYFGTDGPGFYERIGAVKHEHVRGEFFIMRFELTLGQ
jgi:predicted N-acetyltransferase YhbS